MRVSEYWQFSDINVSQGSVATCLRCRGIINEDFNVNLLLYRYLSLKEFWKSVNIWRSYGQDYGGFVFDSVYCHTRTCRPPRWLVTPSSLQISSTLSISLFSVITPITQLESWYSFYRATKGRRLSRPRPCSGHLVLKAACPTVGRDRTSHTVVRHVTDSSLQFGAKINEICFCPAFTVGTQSA